MTEIEIDAMVEALGGISAALMAAHPDDKAEVYRKLGLSLTYEPDERVAKAEVNLDARSWGHGVSEG